MQLEALTNGIKQISLKLDQLYLKGDQHFKLLPPSFREKISLLVNDTTDLFKRSNLDRIAILASMVLPIFGVKRIIFHVRDVVDQKNSSKKITKACFLQSRTWEISKEQEESWKYKIAHLTSYGLAYSIVG